MKQNKKVIFYMHRPIAPWASEFISVGPLSEVPDSLRPQDCCSMRWCRQTPVVSLDLSIRFCRNHFPNDLLDQPFLKYEQLLKFVEYSTTPTPVTERQRRISELVKKNKAKQNKAT